MRRESRREPRGFPHRSSRAEREVLNKKPNGHMVREERATWNVPPRVYATLMRAIADLEIIIEPLDRSGKCNDALKHLRHLERSSSVRWRNTLGDKS